MHNLFKDEFGGSQSMINDCDLFNLAPEDSQEESILNFHFGKVPVPSSFKETAKYVSLLDEIQEELQEKNEIITELKNEVAPIKKNKLSGAYYRVANHDELYKLGETFSPDLERGERIFAFTASENHLSVRNVVMGLAAHFEFHSAMEITIISHKDHLEYYENIFKDADKVRVESFTPKLKLDKTRITLWEVPSGRNVLNQIEDYFPAITEINSCSIIVTKNASKFAKIRKLKQFYSKYKVDIKGIIFEEEVK